MEKHNIVVSDTSPLLNLAFIDQLELLKTQFNEILVPKQVWEEIQEGHEGRKKLENLREKFLKVIEVEEDGLYREFYQRLDKGESAALSYAIRNNADLILLDEKEAREAARNHELKTTGVIGILIKANESDRLNLVKQLERLKEEGFWISDELYQRIADRHS